LNTENRYYSEDEKIDIKELWNILAQRKKMIYTVTLLITLLGVFYAFFSRPVYEVKGIIELAQIDNKNIHNTYDIKQKLDFIYQVRIKGKKLELPIIDSITVPKKTESMLVIKAHGYDNESASSKIEELVSTLKGIQNSEITDYIKLQTRRLKLIQKDINATDSAIKNTQNKISVYEDKLLEIEKEDAALAGIYAIELGKMQSEINILRKNRSELNTEKNELLFSISPTNITSTKLVGDIEILDKPVKPKKVLIIIIAFIFALFLSISLAFVLEFLKKIRKEQL